MAFTDKLWDTLSTLIKIGDKVERMAETMKGQQVRIEDLTLRVVRLETALEIAWAAQGLTPAAKRLDKK